jgi:hypothetical protein
VRAVGYETTGQTDANGNLKYQPISETIANGSTFEATAEEAAEYSRLGCAVLADSADAAFLADMRSIYGRVK